MTPHIEFSLGGSVITERLYIDGKQDLKKIKKRIIPRASNGSGK